MQKRKYLGLGKQNSGFTLVEVIVCMAILGIVFLPLMSYFTNSMGYTLESRNTQSATLAAESILEEFKAGDTFASTKSAYDAQVTLGNTDYVVVEETDPATGVKSTILQRPIDIGGEVYYAVTKATADTGYTNAEMTSMDSSRDIVAMETVMMEMNAILKFMSIHEAKCDELAEAGTEVTQITNQEYFANDMVREIHMDFTLNGDDVTVKTYYKYYLKTSIEGIVGLTDPDDTLERTTVEEVLDESVKRRTELAANSIWIFYSAKPGDIVGHTLSENIIVNIGSGLAANVLTDRLYLICQNRDSIEAAFGGGYFLHTKDAATGADCNYVNKVAKGLYSNMTVQGTADVKPLVTEETGYSRMSDLYIRVFQSKADYDAGEEPLVTLNGVYEGGIQ